LYSVGFKFSNLNLNKLCLVSFYSNKTLPFLFLPLSSFLLVRPNLLSFFLSPFSSHATQPIRLKHFSRPTPPLSPLPHPLIGGVHLWNPSQAPARLGLAPESSRHTPPRASCVAEPTRITPAQVRESTSAGSNVLQTV
jgi:hypothetical protein